MNIYRKIHNPYDISFKYSSIALNKRLHEYLGLPGTYERRYPTEVVTRDMENRRMDELYKTEENMLINLEEESSTLTENTLKKFAIYHDFAR